ncbi:DUF155-domain-containing protein [Metschnikowia bicuspidata var. bicuspidata NRRL YB-4993]|uniref:DUF155-domain-containing protein n=1 Tax=Metschnikowia bicuspidata var. bicuspidata NRRL YB-4993 TaxID=869754 RepID=A0A1A0GZ11_9ASCO|nr:DUF155-domain-containing protein [Metschnikowia bicuspidata var. bicuspidata NRRL YB-4993]OBA16991.1 DUF155-domain-containing protein [Metschnikowia bicuspidata var. bicuspidata NRRL YB-4993]
MSLGASGSARPTAKRSPSILVTDSRTNVIRGTRAPFAGQNYRKQQQQQQKQQQQEQEQQPKHPPPGPQQPRPSRGPHGLQRRLAARANKYTDISVDKLLSNLSDIPSGQSRLPLAGTPSNPLAPAQRSMSPPVAVPALAAEQQRRRNVLAQHLPARTSKNSQRLVLIPDDAGRGDGASGLLGAPDPRPALLQGQLQRSRAELMAKETRAKEFSRVTAYYICEEFSLAALMAFVEKNHNVAPRMYDEALYVPYTLPLLPGTDGLRVRSNDSAKALPNKRYMEKMIAKSEQTDHLYEYYSGVETPEDANNYSMDPETSGSDNSGPFDPSEPQFFAPPLDVAASAPAGSAPPDLPGLQSGLPPGQQAGCSVPPPPPLLGKPRSSKDGKPGAEDHAELLKYHAEMFVLQYGIVVFWNLSETHEKNILADLAFASEVPEPILINPISEQDIETEEFHFDYDPQLHRPRIFNDMITLRSGDHLIKLTMSHAIAQLTKLGLFESRMVHSLLLISKLPKKLALTGRLGLKRQQLLKKSGKLFKLRVDVNLLSSILDTPEFFWSMEPALHPLYNALREYLEIEQRVQVLNDRCKVFLEFLNIVSDSINESSTTRITMMIIVIIFISLGVSIFEFFLDVI